MRKPLPDIVLPPKNQSRRNLDGDGSLAGMAAQYTFNVTGTAGSNTDQLNLFNVPTDVLQSGATLCPTVTQVPSSGYTAGQLAEHFQSHPAPLVNWNIPASTNQNVLASMIYTTVRREATGKLIQDDVPVANLLTASMFQSDRVQFSASGQILFDGATFARFTWTQQTPAVTLTIAMGFGPSFDARKYVNAAAPAVVTGG